MMQHWHAWAVFLGYLVATWFLALLTRRLAGWVVRWLTERTDNALDERLIQVSARPARWVILTAGLGLALGELKERIPSIATGPYANTFAVVENVVTALTILAVAALINAVIGVAVDWNLHSLSRRNSGASWDRKLAPWLKRLSALVVYFIAASVILARFDYEITALITTAGVASLAVALAAQETVANMLGGVIIVADRLFRTGDFIALPDGKMGEVVDIGLRSTHIRQPDGNILVVPNKDMTNNRIINYRLTSPRVAIRQTISVGYGADIEQAKQLLLDVITAHPDVLKDPTPGVWFTTFGSSTLDLFMSCWIESYTDRIRVTDELNRQILKIFREHQVPTPFPQQNVHLHVVEAGGELPGNGET